MKKTNMKKALCSALALCVCLGSFAGCGNDKKTSSDGKMKLSYAGWTLGPVNANSVAEKALEEKFPDVDFDLIAFERSTWVEQISTRIAGGDSPDIIYRDHWYYIHEGVKQNIMAEVPFDMVKENAKEVYDATKDYGIDVWYATYWQGKNYGLPIMQPDQMHGTAAIWRMDWLKKVGINKVPETIEEYEEALTKFVKNDPDGNGKADTIGLSWNMKSNPHLMFDQIISAYAGAKNQTGLIWVDNNEIKYAIDDPEFKEGIDLLADWYKKGLIDPEFITTDASTLTSLWSNGKIGVIMGGFADGYEGGPNYDSLKAVEPNAEIAVGPVPTGPKGQNAYYKHAAPAITSSITFGKQLDKDREKLKKAVSIVNTMMSDKELYGKIKYGIEGTHWKRDPKTNQAVMLDAYKLPQDMGDLGVNIFYGLAPLPSVQAYYDRSDKQDLFKYEENKTQDYLTQSWEGQSIDQDIQTSANSYSDKMRSIVLNVIVGNQTWADVEAYKPEFYAGYKKYADAKLKSYDADKKVHEEMLKGLGVSEAEE